MPSYTATRSSVILSLLILLASTTNAAPQTQERAFPIAADLLYSLVAEDCKKEDAARMTCDRELFDLNSGLQTFKTTLTVVGSSTGSTLRITVKKPTVAERIFAEIESTIKSNTKFGNLGRRTTVTSEEIAEAIAFAKGVKSVELRLGNYEVFEADFGSVGRTTKHYGAVLTPFVRVLIHALREAETYKPLDVASIPRDELEPLTWLVVSPLDLGGVGSPPGRYIDVKTVVLLPTGSTDPSQAIQPTWTRPDDSVLSNSMGARWQIHGVIAAFPTDALKEGRDIVLVYTGGPEKRVPITEQSLLRWWLLPEIRQK